MSAEVNQFLRLVGDVLKLIGDLSFQIKNGSLQGKHIRRGLPLFMERAAQLLESTTMKVIEVANAVGYENQGKFAKVFAETYGFSPLEFRRLSK